jgi:NAD(P)-dependent dehydrogenase (short-subunit alcohol dehydrogenase family)
VTATPPEGRLVVVTGASDGIGAAAARQLRAAGDRLVVVGRSPGKTGAVASALGAEAHVVDFGRLDDVRTLGRQLADRHRAIDVLVNNAGLIAGDRRTVTPDGHELTFQVNHLAPFLLTALLRPSLVAAGGRVIVTASRAGASPAARVVLEDLDMTSGYQAMRAYQASKLENVLFVRELARRWGPLGVSAAALHPGVVRSRFGASGPLPVRIVMRSPLRWAMRSPERGADTIVWLASSVPGKDWRSGGYFENRRRAQASPLADDADLARELWDLSASLANVEA